jgi:hypothetical protein
MSVGCSLDYALTFVIMGNVIQSQTNHQGGLIEYNRHGILLPAALLLSY